jgi:hypothetical protein
MKSFALVLVATYSVAAVGQSSDRDIGADFRALGSGTSGPQHAEMSTSAGTETASSAEDPTIDDLNKVEELVNRLMQKVSASRYVGNPNSNPAQIQFEEAVERRNAIKTAYWAKHPRSAPTEKDKARVEELVRVVLKDSDSAKFRDHGFDSWGQACGYVNAKNSFGGFTGFKRFTIIHDEVTFSSEIFPAMSECSLSR